MDTTEAGSSETRSGPRRRGPARAGLLGAVVGVGAAVGGLLLLTGGAGAQPAVDDGAGSSSAPTETIEADAEAVDLDGEIEFGEEFEAHWACIDEALGAVGIDVDNEDVDNEDGEVDEPDLTDEQWEALEAQLEDCDDLLPAEWLDELEELDEAFEQCLVDNGVEVDDDDWFGDELDDDADHEFDFGPVVFVESEDGSTLVEFGDGDGEVVISKADGEITVNTEGDVSAETISWDDFDDPAFEICESQLVDIEQ